MRHVCRIAFIFTLLAAAPAVAEPPQQGTQPPPGYPQQQPVQQQQPQYYQQPQPQYGQAPPQQQPPQEEEGRGIEYGFHVLVPVFVTEEGLNPGIGIAGRIGWEFGGGLAAGMNVGYQLNSLAETTADANINDFWIGGGVRYSFLNPSAFVPFVGGGVKLHFWAGDLCIDEPDPLGGPPITVCASSDREAALGVVGTVGAAYEISRWAAVEFGVAFDYTLPGNFWADPEGFVSPFVGGTLYY